MTARVLSRRRLLRQLEGTIALFTLSTLTMTTIHAAPSPAKPTPPDELRELLPSARLQGNGNLRFFGLQVYSAWLWVPAAFAPEDYATQPLALELVYDRKLEGSAIADRSIAEMRRVGSFTENQATVWLALMLKAFPDVKAGDRLLGWHDGRGRVRFFFNGRQSAELDDATYARLFFGIWLAPQTSAAGLRRALLNLPE